MISSRQWGPECVCCVDLLIQSLGPGWASQSMGYWDSCCEGLLARQLGTATVRDLQAGYEAHAVRLVLMSSPVLFHSSQG